MRNTQGCLLCVLGRPVARGRQRRARPSWPASAQQRLAVDRNSTHRASNQPSRIGVDCWPASRRNPSSRSRQPSANGWIIRRRNGGVGAISVPESAPWHATVRNPRPRWLAYRLQPVKGRKIRRNRQPSTRLPQRAPDRASWWWWSTRSAHRRQTIVPLGPARKSRNTRHHWRGRERIRSVQPQPPTGQRPKIEHGGHTDLAVYLRSRAGRRMEPRREAPDPQPSARSATRSGPGRCAPSARFQCRRHWTTRVAARLPCWTTGTPPAATTIAARIGTTVLTCRHARCRRRRRRRAKSYRCGQRMRVAEHDASELTDFRRRRSLSSSSPPRRRRLRRSRIAGHDLVHAGSLAPRARSRLSVNRPKFQARTATDAASAFGEPPRDPPPADSATR